MIRTKREIAYRTAGALIIAAAVVPFAATGTATAGGTEGNVTKCNPSDQTGEGQLPANVPGQTIPKSDITYTGGDGEHYVTITAVDPKWTVTGVVVKAGNGYEVYTPEAVGYNNLGDLPWVLSGPGDWNEQQQKWIKKDISHWFACGTMTTTTTTPTPCPTTTVTETVTATATQTVAGPTETVTATETVGGPTVTATEKVTEKVTETQTATEKVTETYTATATVEVPVTTTQTVAGPTETQTVTETATVEVPVTTTQTVTSTVEVPVTTTQTVAGPTETVTETADPVTETATVTESATVTETATASSTETATQTETQTAIVSQTSSMQPGDEDDDPETEVLGNKIAGADNPTGVLAETGSNGMTQKLVLSAALLMLGFALFAAPELLGAARTSRGRRH
jgi:hypothetical protein